MSLKMKEMPFLRICLVILYLLRCSFGFVPISNNQWKSSVTDTEMKLSTVAIGLRLMSGQHDQDFPRNVALQMATKLEFSNDDKMTNSTSELYSRVENLFPEANFVTSILDDHVPLGCTVEESLHEDDDYLFISKVTAESHAERAGLKVGDVIVGVTGLFGEMEVTIDADVEKIKRLVSAVPEEDPLTILVARGTTVLERHESTIVDLCSLADVSDKEVQDCVVDFLAGGYDGYGNDEKNKGDDKSECDEDAECMLDDMMNLWADELQTPQKTGVTEQTVEKDTKPKPWSSRSSPSGTWVRDPETGKMRNIDA